MDTRTQRLAFSLVCILGPTLFMGCATDPKEVFEENKAWAVPRLTQIHRACLDARGRDRVPGLPPTSVELKRHTGYLHFFQERPNVKILGVEFCGQEDQARWWGHLPTDGYALGLLAHAFGVNRTGAKTPTHQPLYFTKRYVEDFPLELETLEPIEYVAFYAVKDFVEPGFDPKKNRLVKGSVGGHVFVYRLSDGALVRGAGFEAESADEVAVEDERFVTITRQLEGQTGTDEETFDLGDYETRALRQARSDFSTKARGALRAAIKYRPTGDRW